ncbi:DUF6090 family protein [Flagellimonas sp. 2504JD4-2]
MIKFFRKIRQRLLSENRFSKYLIYAIGEIILVVIGILIALQINNWNEKQQEKSEELRQLKALTLEFEKNLISFDSIYNHHKDNEDATIKLMNAKNSSYSIEELDELFLKTIYNYNFDPSRGIYNALINSGKIELISNEALKYKLAEIQDIVADYIDDENLARKYGTHDIIPFVVNQMPYNPLRPYKNRSDEEKALHLQYFQEMLNNRVFIEHLSVIKLFRIGVFDEGERVRKEYREILMLINKEINAKEYNND